MIFFMFTRQVGVQLNKKKIILIITIILAGALVIISVLQKTSVIDDDKLIINGYKTRRVSAYDVCIGYVYEDSSMNTNTFVSGHVYKYCYNDKYIGIQQIKSAAKKEDLDISNPIYYLIDTQKNELHKFNSAQEYEEYVNDNKITGLFDWITTPIY